MLHVRKDYKQSANYSSTRRGRLLQSKIFFSRLWHVLQPKRAQSRLPYLLNTEKKNA